MKVHVTKWNQMFSCENSNNNPVKLYKVWIFFFFLPSCRILKLELKSLLFAHLLCGMLADLFWWLWIEKRDLTECRLLVHVYSPIFPTYWWFSLFSSTIFLTFFCQHPLFCQFFLSFTPGLNDPTIGPGFLSALAPIGSGGKATSELTRWICNPFPVLMNDITAIASP